MWTALALGFFGSLHCIAMCGPLLLALPITGSKLPAWRLGIYHFGRLCSYVLLGILMGLLGKGTSIAGLHQSIALFVGSGLVLSGILQLFFNTRRYPTSLFRLYGNLHRRLIQWDPPLRISLCRFDRCLCNEFSLSEHGIYVPFRIGNFACSF
jgi:sulfite exporter TauE/SafE